VDRLRLVPVSDACQDAEPKNNADFDEGDAFSILSFNVLAESYLTPRSHPGLPPKHSEVAFDPQKRRELLIQTLKRFVGAVGVGSGSGAKGSLERFDIVCLQEVDLPDLIVPLMDRLGYGCVHAHASEEAHQDSANDGSSASTTTETNGTPVKQTSQSRGHGRRNNNNRPKSKADTCAIFYCTTRFRLVASETIEFDDLAEGTRKQAQTPRTKSGLSRARKGRGGTAAEPLGGMIQSYRRRNRAVMAVLELLNGDSEGVRAKRKICVSNGHLYWHPGYEYVKLSQAKYWTDKVEEFATKLSSHNIMHANDDTAATPKHMPVLLCGDLNSKPGSSVHAFFTQGSVDARAVAPWNPQYYDALDADMAELEAAGIKGSRSQGAKDPHTDDDPVVPLEKDAEQDDLGTSAIGAAQSDNGSNDEDDEEDIAGAVQNLKLKCEGRKVGDADADDYTAMALTPGNGVKRIKAPVYRSKEIHDTTPRTNAEDCMPRYLCDYTLNRLTRWLRILGVDAALETQGEEKERTANKNPVLFGRCRSERRTLLTTSKTLLLRKDCPPGAYLIDPKKTSDLEKAMVQLFLTHGVVLRPSEFVTRCVVCNGTIYTVADEEDKAKIFEANGCPNLITDLSVYACNGCGQGYWWCEDLPTSSATRVKQQAAHLFQQCLRGGVPYEGELRMFDFVDPVAERKIGEKDGTLAGKGRPEAPMERITAWLKDESLGHSFQFRSAYAMMDSGAGGNPLGELLPFTNVTADFVGLLDYIFFEASEFVQTHRIEVPTSFRALNDRGGPGGHLLPSDVWPSDHLALGARIVLKSTKTDREEIPTAASVPGAGWATPAANHQPGFPMCDCGCVPKVPSLFEMAELRKQAKLNAAMK